MLAVFLGLQCVRNLHNQEPFDAVAGAVMNQVRRIIPGYLLVMSLCWPCAGLAAEPATTRLTLIGPDEYQFVNPYDGTLHFKAIGTLSDAPLPEPFKQPAALPGTVTVALEPNFVWEVTPEIPGWWGEPVVLEPPLTQEHVLSLRITGVVAGDVQPPPHEDMPEQVTVRFESQAVPRSLVACPVATDGIWSCEVPAAELDLRVRARGFVSHFYWARVVKPRETVKLGVQALERGASIVGWVQDEAGQPATSVTVTLRPFEAGEQTSEAGSQRLRQLAHERKSKRDGFFHFVGLPAGAYRIEAEKEDARATLAPVTVPANTEAELTDPLVLQPPASLAIELLPSTDIDDRPWRVTLLQQSEIIGHSDTLGTWPVDETGRLTRSKLEPGRYLVLVEDHLGARLANEQITVQPGDNLLALELPLTWVAGEVTLGGEPLSAEVVFGGPFGAEKVTLETNPDGEFFGYLPRDGEWETWVVSENPPIRRVFETVDVDPGPRGGVAHVRLELPDTTVEGEVVTSAKVPVGRALVRLYEESSTRSVAVSTDAEGKFEFRGVAEGMTRVNAEHGDAASDMVMVTVAEETSTPFLELVLREHTKIAGKVIGPQGQGLPGVRVGATALRNELSLSQRVPSQVTDVEGSFTLDVPAETTHVALTAYPPGFTLTPLPPKSVRDEPIVIRPERVGGSLTLSFTEPPDLRTRAPKPLLMYNGRAITFVELLQWARIMGQAMGEPTSALTVPALPVGAYRVCLSDQQAMNAGNPSAPSRCQDILLSPSASLNVQLGK